MGLFTSINIAATGMSLDRLRTDVISDNIANASTTRTQDGGKFQRKMVIAQAIQDDLSYRNPFFFFYNFLTCLLNFILLTSTRLD